MRSLILLLCFFCAFQLAFSATFEGKTFEFATIAGMGACTSYPWSSNYTFHFNTTDGLSFILVSPEGTNLSAISIEASSNVFRIYNVSSGLGYCNITKGTTSLSISGCQKLSFCNVGYNMILQEIPPVDAPPALSTSPNFTRTSFTVQAPCNVNEWGQVYSRREDPNDDSISYLVPETPTKANYTLYLSSDPNYTYKFETKWGTCYAINSGTSMKVTNCQYALCTINYNGQGVPTTSKTRTSTTPSTTSPASVYSFNPFTLETVDYYYFYFDSDVVAATSTESYFSNPDLVQVNHGNLWMLESSYMKLSSKYCEIELTFGGGQKSTYDFEIVKDSRFDTPISSYYCPIFPIVLNVPQSGINISSLVQTCGIPKNIGLSVNQSSLLLNEVVQNVNGFFSGVFGIVLGLRNQVKDFVKIINSKGISLAVSPLNSTQLSTSISLPSVLLEQTNQEQTNKFITLQTFPEEISGKLFQPSDNEYTISAEVTAASILNDSGEEYKVEGLSAPLKISMSINSSSVTKEMECIWWEESSSSWKTEGCSLDVQDTLVSCLCNHLTNFTVGKRAERNLAVEGPKDNKKVILISVLVVFFGCVTLGAVIFALLVWRRNKKTETKNTSMAETQLEKQIDVQNNKVAIGEKLEIESPYGEVFRGIYQGTTSVVVFALQNSKLSSNFLNESNLLKRIHHPNVVMYLGTNQLEDGIPGMIVEYSSQGSLLDLLKKDPNFSSSQLLSIAKDVAAGLSFLHDGNIVHGGVKANHVWIWEGEEGITGKLSHFHYSLSQDSLTTKVRAKKNNGWLAPEVLNGEEGSAKSDVWSFGVLVWEILTHQLPFEGMSEEEIKSSVLKAGETLTIPSTSHEIKKLVQNCWEKNPSDRPTALSLFNSLTTIVPSKKRYTEREIEEGKDGKGSAYDSLIINSGEEQKNHYSDLNPSN